MDTNRSKSLRVGSKWRKSEAGTGESDYGNQELLAKEFGQFSDNPDLCDVVFLVGMDKTPVYGVRAILAARSRVFLQLLYSDIVADKPEQSRSVIFNKLQPIRRSVKKRFESHRHHQHDRRQVGIRKIEDHIIQVDDFEADVFKQLLEFVHTGSVMLQPRTMLGLLNAADHFGIEDLKRACMQFCDKCIRVETVCALLLTAERYIQYKSTKSYVQKVLDFIALHAEMVLSLNDVVHLPRHVVELILAREDLQATALARYYATERWVQHQRSHEPQVKASTLMEPFLPYIAFHEIPTEVLMRHIRPQGIIPDTFLMNALVMAADCEEEDEKKQVAHNRLTPQLDRNRNMRARTRPGSCTIGHRTQSCKRNSKILHASSNSSDSSAHPKSSNDSFNMPESVSSQTSRTCSPNRIADTVIQRPVRQLMDKNGLNRANTYVNVNDYSTCGTVIMINDDDDAPKSRKNYVHLNKCYSDVSDV